MCQAVYLQWEVEHKQISYEVLQLSKDMVIFNMSLGLLYFCTVFTWHSWLMFLMYLYPEVKGRSPA